MQRWLVALLLACGCRTADKPSAGLAAALPSAVLRPAPSSAAAKESPLVGQTVAVRARHASGAPLHPEPESSSVSGRLAEGSSVRIERVLEGGRWIEVSQGNLRGWLTRRYLVLSSPPPRPQAQSPFASPEACLTARANAARAPRPPGSARLGSWNLHWFPDGKPGKSPPQDEEFGSDLEWLACVISWLDVDALAVQELKGGARGFAALDRLRELLGRQNGGNWQVEVDGCERSGQHVGLLYDQKRVTRLGSFDVTALNPHGRPCQDQLRPGHASYLRFPGGLDLHVVSAHFKAGGQRRSLDLRERSFAALSDAHAATQARQKDADVLILGDLNTMGCPDCSPPLSHIEELSAVDRSVSAEGFRRLESDVACSHYFGGKGTLLDGALAAQGFAELGEEATVQVSGLCAEIGCDPPSKSFPAQERLSDHCPIVVDIRDRDQD